jgi:phosphate starvation-inducible PhoH-like protein
LRKNNKNKKKPKTIDLTNVINDENRQTGFAYKNRLKPRTPNQTETIRTVAENTISFCVGAAGTGKTHIAVGMAIEYLLDNKVDKIIITRPVVESGEKLGYLPGTAEEKLHPYLLPILDEIVHFIPISQYITLKTQNKIEIAPLALMRGRNFHNSFIVADECQNASYDQLKMLLTRIGNNSKMVLTGDDTQSDLHRSMRGGFTDIKNALDGVSGIGISHLQNIDIIRNPIISRIIDRLDNYENSGQK